MMQQELQQTDIQSDGRLDDLTEIIRAYNEVTENLQRSHVALRQQVQRLQEELASTDAKLQRSKRLAALGEMAAGIAHEIRNPLAAIQLYAKMIIEDVADAIVERDQSPAQLEGHGPCKSVRDAPTSLKSESPAGASYDRLGLSLENAKKIASAVRGLNGIVNDVLTFSREIQPRLQTIRAAELLQRALDMHRPAIETAHIQVQMRGETDLMLSVDPELLQQALLNLVRNAVDAMEPTGGMLTCTVEATDMNVIITVQDTGPGISETDIDRIFNPFFTTRNTGTGLGLAIVHRILDAHGGSISAGNDNGAVFELFLPPHAGLHRKNTDERTEIRNNSSLNKPATVVSGAMDNE